MAPTRTSFLFAVISSAILLCGYDGRDVQYRIAQYFRDPDSVKFSDFHLKDGVACGKVNAKNAFGAYVGFQPFYATISDGNGPIEPIFPPADAISDEEFKINLQTDREACAYQKSHPGMGYIGCTYEPNDRARLSRTKSYIEIIRKCSAS